VGATPLLLPLIEIVPPADMAALDAAARAASGYDWLFFTSANAVDALWDRIEFLGLPNPLPVQTAVIGPSTGRALERRGQPVDFIPNLYTDEALAMEVETTGKRILFRRRRKPPRVVVPLICAGPAQSWTRWWPTATSRPIRPPRRRSSPSCGAAWTW
jgi:uroporphyrinogen-III synthase